MKTKEHPYSFSYFIFIWYEAKIGPDGFYAWPGALTLKREILC